MGTQPGAAGGPEIQRQDQAALLQAATLGEYEILGELGRGGMATVYLGHELALDRKVAIKVMAPALVHGDGMIERFKREARTSASLSHPHIIPVYAVRETEQLLFFVMKFIAGRPLDSVIKELGPLPIPMVQLILQQAGNAFGYAHRRGIIHRDIKPANIMIDDEGWTVVTDFGIAKVSQAEGLTMTGMTVGTPTYMSPEQCMAQDVTGASDQYSLGVVAYEMITGRPPFTGGSMMAIMYGHFNDPPPPIEAIRPECPEGLRTAVLRMLEKDPAKRWPSVEEAVEAIGAPPAQKDDPVRTQLIELASKSENTKLLKRLSTPISPAPLTKRTRAGAPAAAPRAGGGPRTAPVVVASPPPTASRTPLYAGAAAVVAIGLALAVWQPWKPAPAPPPVAVAPSPAAGTDSTAGAPQSPAGQSQSTQQGGADSAAVPAPAPGPAPAQPVVDQALLRRQQREFQRVLAQASQARTRASLAGASPPELRAGDALKSAAEQLAGRGQPGDAMRPLDDAVQAYATAESAAATRAAQVRAAAQQASAPPTTIPQQSPAQQRPEPQPSGAVPGPATAPAQAAPAVTDERPAVELALREYARALSASDLPAMTAVYPGMPGDVKKAFQDLFRNKYSVDTSRWRVFDIQVTGTTASAKIGGVSILRDDHKKTSEQPTPKGATLEKVGGAWRVIAID
jgi:serine/threonine protein kinase